VTWDEQLVYALGALACKQGRKTRLELAAALKTPLTSVRLERLGNACMQMALAWSYDLSVGPERVRVTIRGQA